MSDISHSDYCPVDNIGDIEDCEHCMAEQERQAAYYGALYAREKRYTPEEIEDCYSEPSERHKRDSMLRFINAD